MPPDFTPYTTAPTHTFFHSRQWIDALLGAFPRWRDASCEITLPDGRRVLLPMLETDRVGPWRWLDAMPFAFFGGPVVTEGDLDGEALAHILDVAGRGAGWLAVNLDPGDPLAAPGVVVNGTTSLTTHLLALDPDFEMVQRGFTKTVRYDMRRGERDGVTARRGTGLADFRTYYGLSALAAKRWGLADPPYPAPLYEALAVLPQDRVSLWLAEFEGQVIGGLINAHYMATRTIHWSSAINPAYAHLNPTKLLQREAIREACERQATVYNMGPSVGFDGAILDGVRRAKEALGAKPHDYTIAILTQPWALRVRAVRDRLRRFR